MPKINGPINVLRLEGQIFNIKKVIYIYFDHHYDVNKQTKCDDFLADDVVVYLNKEFAKIDDKYIDFFMETSFDQRENLIKNIKYKERYIDEINKFFMKNIIIKNNKNIGTPFKKIRFHYADIRNEFRYIIYDEFKTSITELFNKIKSKIINNATYSDYKNSIDIIRKMLDKLKHIIKAEDNNLINKIKNKYTHPEIKNKIIPLIDNLFDYIEIIKNNLINIQVLSDAEEQYLEIIQLYAWLMDIYFLRRFLDKDYITNAIIYCGVGHSIRYIIFLIKSFDFKITHASYSSKPLPLVNQIIKESTDEINHNDISKYFINNYIQCIDITSFPENFS